jgi:hypothetical protein
MKRARPLSSAASSKRSIGCPIQRAADVSAVSGGTMFNGTFLAAFNLTVFRASLNGDHRVRWA